MIPARQGEQAARAVAETMRLPIATVCFAIAGKANADDLKEAVDLLLDSITAALAAAEARGRAEEREACAVVADTELVPDEDDPAAAPLANVSPILAAIAAVHATKKAIAERIRARTAPAPGETLPATDYTTGSEPE